MKSFHKDYTKAELKIIIKSWNKHFRIYTTGKTKKQLADELDKYLEHDKDGEMQTKEVNVEIDDIEEQRKEKKEVKEKKKDEKKREPKPVLTELSESGDESEKKSPRRQRATNAGNPPKERKYKSLMDKLSRIKTQLETIGIVLTTKINEKESKA